MQLDERLRQVADQVPAPPAGDAPTIFHRGVRRRRRRMVMRGTVAVVLVGVLGVGVASLLDRPARLDIANEPATPASPHTAITSEGPAITQPPALTVSGREPFAWVVAVSAGEGDRWCVTTRQGTTEVADQVGQPCAQPLSLDQDLDWHESTEVGSGGQQLVWGSTPVDTEVVVVEFTDGTRRTAELASSDAVGVTLWALGHEQGDVHAVEAQGEGWAGGGVVLDGFDVGDLLVVLAGLVGAAVLLVVARRRMLRRNNDGAEDPMWPAADRSDVRAAKRWATRLDRAPWRWLTAALETVTRPRSRRQRWLIGGIASLVLAAGFVAASIGYTYINAWSDCMRLAPETARIVEPSTQWQGMVCTFTDEDGQVIDTRTLPWIGKAPGT